MSVSDYAFRELIAVMAKIANAAETAANAYAADVKRRSGNIRSM